MKIFSGFSLVIIFFVLFSLESFSVEKKDIQILNENLPSFMGASNAGKEFYLTFHPCWNDAASPNSSLRIYVSSMYKTTVKLEIPGLGITRTKEIIPNEVIEFPLLVSEGLLYDKGNGADPIPPKPEGVGIKRAIKITSDDPIVCYGMVRFQYTSDGYLAIPVNNWGKHYQVASYADPNTSGTQFLPSYTSIIAAYDNTEVTFKLGGSITAGALLQNNDTLRIGESIKRVLNAGDVWLIPGIGLLNDLTGSQITADKNIGVYSGNFCAYVPTHIAACDYIIEQEIPSDFWGKNYYVPTIYNRKKASIVKIFAKEPNTSISFNNVPLYNITALDGKEGTGYIETRASTDSIPTPVLINSDKEINVVLFNPGQQDDNVSSDPFQMNIVSDAQFQKDITFNTPGIRGGLGFRDNYISIIYKATPEGKIPDDIYYAEINNGQISWIKMNDYSSNPGTPFPYDLPDQNGRKHYCKTIRLPYDGVYKIKANEPFAALGYGFGDYDSYGYPLSGAMIDQTNGDILVPEVKMVDLGNGNYKGLINELGNPDGESF